MTLNNWKYGMIITRVSSKTYAV